MKLTVPQYRALEAVRRGKVTRGYFDMGDTLTLPGIGSQAIEALLKVGLIADGAMLGNRVTMVLTLKGEVALDAEPR
jgi:hypothetical protein